MKNKKVLVIAGIIAGVAFLCLVGLFFFNSREYFSGQFGRKTYISNTDVSSLTVEEAVAVMNESKGFTVQFSKDGKVYDIDISDAVTREFTKDEVVECKDNLTFTEYLLGQEKDFQVKPAQSMVDEEKLRSILQRALPAETTETKDAFIDEEFQLVPEVFGDQVNFDELIHNIKEGVNTGLKLDYKLEDYYIQPKFTKESENIVKAVEEISTYKGMKIVYQFGEASEIIDWNKLKKYLVYNPDTAVLTLKTKWVNNFVRQMSRKYNTYGKTRKFKTTKDGTVKIQGGIMGWWINEDDTVKQLKKLLKDKKSKTVEPVYRNIAAQHGEDDIGDTYVEISIKRQHVWFYKDGKLKFDSKTVTGKLTKDRKTTVGVHRIYGKQRDRYLGTMAVQGYRSFVHYWMPFNWDGQGLHDATWRNKFGGDIYKTGGSHGCVNLPYDFAGKLYDAVSIGTPVVVY
ncbi:L,D-transpeptidase family protein [Parabacteroides goldsteinii]|jgi:lipoprotein-anchoring transpeptidase ErfK/SrfK|uniref:L,D-transpeptidase family protein n=1 Tax=Parabacteroides goldsteinii TaxID=328812 RepID=UPI00216F2817|nr:L,D-transpeptidase family protein [Parabacteroides goldsteinii]MCI9539315.1 L,D-transpeptidase family protein [Eubacterium sp.]